MRGDVRKEDNLCITLMKMKMKMSIDRMTLEFYYFSKYYLYVEMNKGNGRWEN